VTLDAFFDLSDMNDNSETCQYNPGALSALFLALF